MNRIKTGSEAGLLAIGLCFLSFTFASNTITDYKSGISLSVAGTDETDYAFERFYCDSLFDDHGVIYIKGATRISLAHNARNIGHNGSGGFKVIGVNGEDGSANSGDEGVIRYRVDRDYQLHKFAWSASASRFPAYTAPFSLSGLSFAAGVPVVGTTGPVPGISVSDKNEFYYRGTTDDFGDEWHTLTTADDDQWVCDVYGRACGTWSQSWWASDGKVWLLVVNPQTPLVYFKTTTPGAQYYTTPAKSYFIPRIHRQTTYLTDNVDIQLVNIMNGNPVYYRVDSGSFQQYGAPINSNTLSDGEHTLEYYYQDSHHKTRKLVKNPPYPSDADNIAGVTDYRHGYLLWKSDAELQAVRERNTGATAREPYIANYRNARSTGGWGGTEQDNNDLVYHSGVRSPGGKWAALHNAILAAIEGFDARINTKAPFVEYAKRFMMEHQLCLDPCGYEKVVGGANPNAGLELYDEVGYYAKDLVVSLALAYDLLITRYRPPAYPAGFTAIEDHKLRDMLARAAVEGLMEMGRYSAYPAANNQNGMTGSTAEFAGLIAGVAIPSYSTPYYGTAGFDGTTQTYPHTPYPDHAVTWKAAFFDESITLYSFPNQANPFGLGEMILPDGTGTMGAYYAYHLTGHWFEMLSNIMKIRLDHTYPSLESAFKKAHDGTQCYSHGMTEGYYTQPLVVNERFPDLAQDLNNDVVAHEGWVEWLYRSDPLGMVWFHDDWEDYVAGVEDDFLPAHNTLIAVYPNPVTDLVSWPGSGSATLKVFTSTGTLANTAPLQAKNFHFRYNAGVLSNGLYFYVLGKGGQNIPGTFVIAR